MIDPSMQMFISACCTQCHSTHCEGALIDLTARATCQKYATWQKLSEDRQSKLFLAAMVGELILLEDLICEG